MKKRRIFISVDIPKELKNVAESLIGKFYKNKLTRVVEKENWHITIVFCGCLNDDELNALKEQVRKIAEETKQFELIPDKIIFKNNRMIWITFKHSPEFSKLSKRFSQFIQNNREQFPHSTLVRFKEFHYPNIKKLLPETGIDLVQESKPFLIEHINIMESQLSTAGPKYKLLEKISLKY